MTSRGLFPLLVLATLHTSRASELFCTAGYVSVQVRADGKDGPSCGLVGGAPCASIMGAVSSTAAPMNTPCLQVDVGAGHYGPQEVSADHARANLTSLRIIGHGEQAHFEAISFPDGRFSDRSLVLELYHLTVGAFEIPGESAPSAAGTGISAVTISTCEIGKTDITTGIGLGLIFSSCNFTNVTVIAPTSSGSISTPCAISDSHFTGSPVAFAGDLSYTVTASTFDGPEIVSFSSSVTLGDLSDEGAVHFNDVGQVLFLGAVRVFRGSFVGGGGVSARDAGSERSFDAVRFVGVESKLFAPLDVRDGGATGAYTTAQVSRSHFVNCTGALAGALLVGATASVINSVFSGNRTPRGDSNGSALAAAIALDDGDDLSQFTLTGNTFECNALGDTTDVAPVGPSTIGSVATLDPHCWGQGCVYGSHLIGCPAAACAPGAASPNGVLPCRECSEGAPADPTQQSCDACEPGSFSPSAATPCARCPEGTVAEHERSTACVACPAGEVPIFNHTECFPASKPSPLVPPVLAAVGGGAIALALLVGAVFGARRCARRAGQSRLLPTEPLLNATATAAPVAAVPAIPVATPVANPVANPVASSPIAAGSVANPVS